MSAGKRVADYFAAGLRTLALYKVVRYDGNIMFTVYSISLGCPKNRVDTERALGALLPSGPVRTVADPLAADLVFINTCAFIAPAIEETVRVILEHIELLKDAPPDQRPLLAVAGCLVGRYGEKALKPDLPEVDLLLDNRSLDKWPDALRNALARKAQNPAVSVATPAAPVFPRLLSTGPSYAWLKISDGCRHACSFCTIPSIRGPLRSYPEESLTAEAKALLDTGVKELVLVAQDLTAWGCDQKSPRKLLHLLERLLPLPGLERLRLMYLYPAGLTSDLLDFLKQAGPPFVPYFDVPLQHASLNVLRRMGRPFASRPMTAVERIRDVFPDAALRTSLITGFPGETEADFEELRQFVADVRFQHLGVFAYQAEEGTPAASMPGEVPEQVREERRAEIMAMQAEISAEWLEEQVGCRMPVLVDAEHPEWPGLHVGRTWFQAPESDGITYISGPGVTSGALVQADITESADYDLVALTGE